MNKKLLLFYQGDYYELDILENNETELTLIDNEDKIIYKFNKKLELDNSKENTLFKKIYSIL